MTSTMQAGSSSASEKRFILLKGVNINFTAPRPDFAGIFIRVLVEGQKYESQVFAQGSSVAWSRELYVSSAASISISCHKKQTVTKKFYKRKPYAGVTVDVKSAGIEDNSTRSFPDDDHRVLVQLEFGQSIEYEKFLKLLGKGVSSALADKVVFLDKLGKISDFIDGVIKIGVPIAELNTVAKVVFGVAEVVFKKFQAQREYHETAVKLVETVLDKLDVIEIIPEKLQNELIRRTLQKMLKITEDALKALDNYANNFTSNTKADAIKDLNTRLTEVSANLALSLTAYNNVMAQENEERQKVNLLEKLEPVKSARFSKGDKCLEETRTEVLEDITTKLEERNPSWKLIWLHGFAGSGKSSIAATVRDELEDKEMLAGIFFCKRDDTEQRESGRVLPSLSYSLARLCKVYGGYIIRALEKDPDIASSPISYQLSKLFLDPFSELRKQKYTFEKPIVFVVDALDECGKDDSTRSQMAQCLTQIAALADWLRVFVTSRPLPMLEEIFSPSLLHHCIDLNKQDCEGDIMKYTKSRLVGVPYLDGKWLEEDAIKALTRKASGLFIWTWTMTEFIRDLYDRNGILEKIVAGQDIGITLSSLDLLYMTVISRSPRSDVDNRPLMKAVLGAIYITAKNRPLSIDGLWDLMPDREGSTFTKAMLKEILGDLRSVLYEDSSKGNAIRVCHPSFLDFLGSHARCGAYWTDPNEMDEKMIKKCLALMKTLRFNICGLESSSVPNEEVHGLKKMIEEEIPESLQYGCLYWATHCTEANFLIVKEPIEDFFGSLQVIYWLEVLSLIDGLRKGLEALEAVEKIYGNEIARDTYKLLTSSYDAIRLSTPHLYVSALTWLPNESKLKQMLYGRFSNQPLLSSGRNKRWDPALWMNAMGGTVRQVAFSPDGRHVAACSVDETICIWEATTGLLAMKLTGHSDLVLSISYSPDSRQLVSGSVDNTVRVWDMSTGTAVGAPLVGHKHIVSSVCYSTDGRYIASRSWDKSVKIWDSVSRSEVRTMDGLSEYGAIVYSPCGRRLACCGLEGIIVRDAQSGDLIGQLQIGYVSCLTYSPDGRFLASGNLGRIVWLFGADTLAELAVLQGHGAGVLSVAFSPDSRQLLSASQDSTMIRWDVASKKMIGTPLRAHGASILSAAYTPDGFYVVSGSADKTVRVWDARSTSDVELPRKKYMFAVACSPCGEEFAAAEQGGNIRIRDVNTGAVLRTLAGHTSSVRAVAYSPSGKILASGSFDRTARLWDTATGDELRRFEGHSAILSIVFAPTGKQVISASDDGTVRRWRTVSRSDRGELLVNYKKPVRVVCISLNGELLAWAGEDETVWFFDLYNGCDTEQHCTSAGKIQSLAFSPNGKNIVSGGAASFIHIWDLETYSEVRRLEGHTNLVTSLAFSFDGKLVLSSSADDTVRLWDSQTGAEFCVLNGHTNTVTGAAFTNDERRIISASHDGTCRIWRSSFPQIGPSCVPEAYRVALSRPLPDGWIRTGTGELVLWVSPEYRDAIRDMCEICVPEDPPGCPVRLDWSKLVKGDAWTSILKAGQP